MRDIDRIHKYQDKLLDGNFDPKENEEIDEDDLYELGWDQDHNNDPEEDTDDEG
jgi:hypothetical protein